MKPRLEVSWWDRFLVSLVPQFGMQRLQARASIQQLERHYEAATSSRRTENWTRDAKDADLTLRGAARDLRLNARDLIRNNAWARRAQNVIANNTVGWGIIPKATGADAGINTAAMDLWKTWAESTECESDNRATFYGIQHLIMRALVADGEVLIRRRFRRPSDGLTIPLQLQVLEADYLNTAMNALSSEAGGPIVQGIEFDKLGSRAAYWLWSQHPGSGRNAEAPKRVPADEVIHVFDVERPGQSRGVSWLASAIVNLKDLDDYDDAEIMKQKIAACFAAFVTDTDGLATPLGDTGTAPDDPVDTFEPGMIVNLPPGKTVVSASPPTMTSDALPMRTLRRVAAGIGVTYEDLTGDYSQVNFSSARMARIAHWGNVHRWQESMLIPLLCMPVWNWAMEAAVLAGALPIAPRSTWTPPPMPMLEPDKEGLALQRLIRTGAMTPSQMVREQGRDPEAHWSEYAADLKALDTLGIVLDSDVRAMTQAGQAQPPPPAPATDTPADPPTDAPPAKSNA
jgi:lambda family phage portal protein